MLRKLFIILFLTIVGTLLQAQNAWNYNTVDEAYNDRAYLLRPNADTMEQVAKQARLYRNGRYSRLTAAQLDSLAFCTRYILTGPYVIGRMEHLRLQSDESDFYVPTDIATLLFTSLVSEHYWNARLDSLRHWSYVDKWNLSNLLDCDTSTHSASRYATLEWLGYEFQPSENNPVVFVVSIDGGDKQPLSLAVLRKLKTWGALAEASTVERYSQAINMARAMRQEADRRQRQEEDSLRDGNIFTATVLRDLIAESVDETGVAQVSAGAEVLLYAYTDTIGSRDCFYGRFRNESYKFAYGDLRFLSQDDVIYLMRRGREGLQQRLSVATWADSVASERYADSVAEAHARLREQIEQTKRDMDNRQVFIMNLNLAHSDYQFGLEFNFYNCFNKTIRKIEMQVTAYNAAGNVQRDKFDRRMRDVRCMGPIPPQSPAQYTFDELFWDSGGKIRYLRLTYIKFTFADGSTRAYNGYEDIAKHILNP
ncbi:MAG: hypothetical protein K5650_03355 [Bacteroidales bacterium]|nr:hypothetical protein [Bacteroidales bacterium]